MNLDLKKTKIAVILGGSSSEREVSLRSGENVYQALKRKGYNVIKIDLNKNIVENLKKEKAELAYIILHGAPGEDGTIQGLLEIIGIPYTGSGILGSAISLNKIVTKQLFIANNIPTPPAIILREKFTEKEKQEAIKMGFPLMLKPASEGSSIGVKKLNNLKELEANIEEFLQKYRDGLIEKYIKGKDITVGIIEDKQNIKALPVLELVPKSEFYDYEAKYTKGKTEFILPANLTPELTRKVQELAIKAHRAVWCYGVSRVDMVVDGENVYVLEVNSIPGMTETSDLPAEARTDGIEFDELVERILESAFITRKYMIPPHH